jgi:hypothetical protein
MLRAGKRKQPAWLKKEIEVPHVPLHEDVELHLIPDLPHQALEVRIWFQYKMVHSLILPLDPHLATFQLFLTTFCKLELSEKTGTERI